MTTKTAAPTIKAFDAAGVELFSMPGSKSASRMASARANQKAINAKRAEFPLMHNIQIITPEGRVVDRLLVGTGDYLNPAVLRDGVLVSMF